MVDLCVLECDSNHFSADTTSLITSWFDTVLSTLKSATIANGNVQIASYSTCYYANHHLEYE